MSDFLDGWLPLGCKNYGQKLITFAGALWSLWTTRNKMAIKGVFVKNPTDVLFKIDLHLQRWRILLRATDQMFLDGWRPQVKAWIEDFLEKVRDHPPEQDPFSF